MCIGSQGDPFITETSITRARGGVYSGHTGLIYRGVREGGREEERRSTWRNYIGVWSSYRTANWRVISTKRSIYLRPNSYSLNRGQPYARVDYIPPVRD